MDIEDVEIKVEAEEPKIDEANIEEVLTDEEAIEKAWVARMEMEEEWNKAMRSMGIPKHIQINVCASGTVIGWLALNEDGWRMIPMEGCMVCMNEIAAGMYVSELINLIRSHLPVADAGRDSTDFVLKVNEAYMRDLYDRTKLRTVLRPHLDSSRLDLDIAPKWVQAVISIHGEIDMVLSMTLQPWCQFADVASYVWRSHGVGLAVYHCLNRGQLLFSETCVADLLHANELTICCGASFDENVGWQCKVCNGGNHQ